MFYEISDTLWKSLMGVVENTALTSGYAAYLFCPEDGQHGIRCGMYIKHNERTISTNDIEIMFRYGYGADILHFDFKTKILSKLNVTSRKLHAIQQSSYRRCYDF